MSAMLPIFYFLGMLVAVSVMRARAGTGWWHGMKVFGPQGFGPVFVVKVVVLVTWPVTLVVWLLRGRPEPRVVFNEKAEERQRRVA